MVYNANTDLEVKIVNMYDFFQDYEIIIEKYQRAYEYKPNNIDNIKNELDNSIKNGKDFIDKKRFYMSGMLITTDKKNPNILKNSDGQQRLVTFNLFIAAIRAMVKRHGLKHVPKLKLFKIIYQDEKIKNQYEHTIEGRPDGIFRTSYNYIYKFCEDNIDKLDLIENYIKNIDIDIKINYNMDKEAELFEYQNSGLPLKPTTVIRDMLEQKIKEYGFAANNTLKTLLLNDVMAKKLLNNLKYFAISKSHEAYQYKIGSTNDMRQLVGKYIDNAGSLRDFQDFCLRVEELEDSNCIYLTELINKDNIKPIIYLADIYYRHTNLDNNKEFVNLFYLIIGYCIINSLRGINPSGAKLKILHNVCDGLRNCYTIEHIKKTFIETINRDLGGPITLEEMSKLLITNSNNNENLYKTILILKLWERNFSMSLNLKSSNFQLEHIYSQNPNKDWAANGWPVSELDRKKYINSFTNLILLNSAINEALRNEFITKKIPEYLKRDAALNFDLNNRDYSQWENGLKGMDYICSYSKELAKEIANINNWNNLII